MAGLTSWLSFRRAMVLAVVLATVAAAPMLASGWDEDEVFLAGAVSGTSPWMNGRFDAYRFSSGEPDAVAALIAKGSMPWYTAPDFKYALFRPGASALLWLDSLLFGSHRIGWQLDAALWHALLVVGAGLVLRRLVPGLAGRVALLLFALGVTHTTATAWLTARHVLVAAVPAIFGLWLQVRARTTRERAGAIVLFALSLAASEAGIQMLAYAGAIELARAAPWKERLRRVLPVVALVAAYLLLYRALGRGHDYGSAFGSPLAFLTRGLPRLVLHACVLLGVSLRPDNPWGFYALRWTMIAALPALLLAWPALRRLDSREEVRAGSGLALGGLLALVPVIGAPLESRVLLPASLGGAVVVAAILVAGVRAPHSLLGAGALVVALVHVVVAPIELPLHYAAIAGHRERRLGTFLRATTRDRADADVLVVGAPHFLFGQLGGYLRERMTGVRTGRWVALADANCAHRVTRTGPDRLEIEPRCREGFFPYGILAKGDVVRQLGWTVTVLSDHPRGRFEVRFDRPLEETRAQLVSFEGFVDRVVPFPGPGAAVELPEPAPFSAYQIDGPTEWLHVTFGN